MHQMKLWASVMKRAREDASSLCKKKQVIHRNLGPVYLPSVSETAAVVSSIHESQSLVLTKLGL